MLTTRNLKQNILHVRAAARSIVFIDAWVSMAFSQIPIRMVTSSRHFTSLPTSDFSEYRADKIYDGFRNRFFSEENVEKKAQDYFAPLASGKITSINDLFNVCKALHLVKNAEEKESKDLLKYKDSKGFTLPKHMRYWFRGHSDKTYKLVPTLFRKHHFAAKEDLMIKEFLLKNPQPTDTNIFNILSKMQHYGYPTRLLDWTSSIMAAAYFACSGHADSNDSGGIKDGMIWILEPYKLSLSNRISETLGGIALIEDFDAQIRALQSLAFDFSELRNDYGKCLYNAKHLLGTKNINSDVSFERFCERLTAFMGSKKETSKLVRSIAIEPGCLNDRLAAQNGKFTLSGGKQYQEQGDDTKDDKLHFSQPKFLAEDKEDLEGSYLSNLVIPGKCKASIREDLELILGIDMESFMLDLNSQAEMATRRLMT